MARVLSIKSSKDREAAFARDRSPAQNQQSNPYSKVFSLQRIAGNRAVEQMMHSGMLNSLGTGAILQRKCACGGAAGASGKCAKCSEEETLLQRHGTGESESSQVPPIVHEVLSSSGQPLNSDTRAFMESRLGHDFSQVQVHTDSKAAESVRAVNALAYTVGKNIVFGTGQYAPTTDEGKQLLAHELTHVVQQQETTIQPKLILGSPNSLQEQEADDMARKAMSELTEQTLSLQTPSTSVLQRQMDFDEETEEEIVASVDENDLDVRDGDSPSGSTVAVSEQSDVQLESDLLSMAIEKSEAEEENETVLLAAADKKAKKSPSKGEEKKEKKETPWITKIEIDLSSQRMKLIWSGDRKLETITISSGKGCPNTKENPCESGDNLYCTPTGEFSVGKKGDGDYKNSKGDPMSWYVEFVSSRGIGIHNSQTADGNPRSHGCVRVGKGAQADALAKRINLNVNKKTKISVSGKAPTKPWLLSKEKTMKSNPGCPLPPEPKPKSKSSDKKKIK
ncbi:DUF4157 domain-containing protein [Nostoc sp. UIC 10607]|uniref:eCIS core domain-containing protein n=1 Tax=Nostoc sp. UIC 10607 TaxID=3045935 RepID=UPI0039A1D3C3